MWDVLVRPLIIGIGKDDAPLELNLFSESRFQKDGLRPIVKMVVVQVFVPLGPDIGQNKLPQKSP